MGSEMCIRDSLKPALGLFHGSPGAGRFKREVDALAKGGDAGVREILERAAALVPDDALDAPPVLDVARRTAR